MDKEVKEEELRVASSTNVSSLAGAIAKIVDKGIPCSLISIGASSLNQAVKSIAIANRLLGSSGVSLSCQPCFITLDLSNEKKEGHESKSEVTGIKLKVIVSK